MGYFAATCEAGLEGAAAPTGVVIVVSIVIGLFAVLSWKSAQGESWAFVAFLLALILGFNTNHQVAAWFIVEIAGMFIDISDMITDAIGSLTIIIVLLFTAYIFHKLNFDMLRVIAIGTLLGIVLRLAVDGIFWLFSAAGWIFCG